MTTQRGAFEGFPMEFSVDWDEPVQKIMDRSQLEHRAQGRFSRRLATRLASCDALEHHAGWTGNTALYEDRTCLWATGVDRGVQSSGCTIKMLRARGS